MYGAGKYEILYDAEAGDYAEEAIGGIRTKTIRSGEILEVEAFPILTSGRAQAEREKERRRTTAAQEKVNQRNAAKKIDRLLNVNFDRRDFMLTLTWDYGIFRQFRAGQASREEILRAGLPGGEDEVRRELRNYLDRVRRRVRREGGNPKEIKWMYVIESTHEPRDGDPAALPAQYHIHLVISTKAAFPFGKAGRKATAPSQMNLKRCTEAAFESGRGLGRDVLEELWGHGLTRGDHLQPQSDGLKGLAKYLTKRSRFTRRWACSRNLKKPDVRVSDRKISRRRAAQVARDVQAFGREVFEKLYPDYRFDSVEVRFSDFIDGAYIYARMVRRTRTCGTTG